MCKFCCSDSGECEHSANVLHNRVLVWVVPKKLPRHGQMSPLGSFSRATAGYYSFPLPSMLHKGTLSASSHSSIHEGKGLVNQDCRRWTDGAALIRQVFLLFFWWHKWVNSNRVARCCIGYGFDIHACTERGWRAVGTPVLCKIPYSRGQQLGITVRPPGCLSSGGHPSPFLHPKCSLWPAAPASPGSY